MKKSISYEFLVKNLDKLTRGDHGKKRQGKIERRFYLKNGIETGKIFLRLSLIKIPAIIT